MTPERIHLRRARGWRMPPNTVKVTRPGRWGNPFIVNPKVRPGSKSGVAYFAVPTIEDAIACFEEMIESMLGEDPIGMRARLDELRGKNLACFCALDEPCHADVLLRIANEVEHGS